MEKPFDPMDLEVEEILSIIPADPRWWLVMEKPPDYEGAWYQEQHESRIACWAITHWWESGHAKAGGEPPTRRIVPLIPGDIEELEVAGRYGGRYGQSVSIEFRPEDPSDV